MLGIDVSERTAEGWFGRGKASAIASIVVFALLLMSIIAVATFFAISVGGRANPADYTEPDKYAHFAGKTAISSTVLSDASKVKVTYKLDDVITAEGSGLLIVRTLTLENKSDRVISQADLSLKVIDDKGKVLYRDDAIPILNIGPGETGSSAGLVAFSSVDLAKLDNPKGFIITLENAIWGTAAPTPAATISPIEGSPGKVVQSFYRAWLDGKYKDMLGYLNSTTLKNIASIKDGEQKWTDAMKELYNEKPFGSMDVLKEDISGESGYIDCRVNYLNKTTGEISIRVMKESGVWRVIP